MPRRLRFTGAVGGYFPELPAYRAQPRPDPAAKILDRSAPPTKPFHAPNQSKIGEYAGRLGGEWIYV